MVRQWYRLAANCRNGKEFAGVIVSSAPAIVYIHNRDPGAQSENILAVLPSKSRSILLKHFHRIAIFRYTIPNRFRRFSPVLAPSEKEGFGLFALVSMFPVKSYSPV
jgi:hypothetical protein